MNGDSFMGVAVQRETGRGGGGTGGAFKGH